MKYGIWISSFEHSLERICSSNDVTAVLNLEGRNLHSTRPTINIPRIYAFRVQVHFTSTHFYFVVLSIVFIILV
jgi:hypothetical protein